MFKLYDYKSINDKPLFIKSRISQINLVNNKGFLNQPPFKPQKMDLDGTKVIDKVQNKFIDNNQEKLIYQEDLQWENLKPRPRQIRLLRLAGFRREEA